MDNKLKISIIVPVYNAEKHLRQCLNSLLEQGIKKEDYEIICINDGSQDGSLSIMKDYADKHQNIIVINKENEGVSATRNRGLDIAQGKYVWFVDADDWIARDFLNNSGIIKLFDEECTYIPLVMTKSIDVYDCDVEKYYNYRVSTNEFEFKETSPFMTTARGHFFNRNLIVKNNLHFDINLAYGEDLIFMREFLDFIRFEKEGGHDCKVLQCNGKGVYFYRIHDASAMSQLHNRMGKVADSILYRARWSLERYKMDNKPDWYKANYQEYVNLHMQEYMIYYFPALQKAMWEHLKELKKEGLYPSPPPKLGWEKQKNVTRKIQQFAFKHSIIYPLYYMVMRSKFKKAGTI